MSASSQRFPCNAGPMDWCKKPIAGPTSLRLASIHPAGEHVSSLFLRGAENMAITLNSRFVRFAIRSKAENEKIIGYLIDNQ